MSWHAENLLAPLGRRGSIAAGVPGTGLGDLTWDRFTRDGQRRFYRVRPRDPEAQATRVLRLLAAADAEGVAVLVLVEGTMVAVAVRVGVFVAFGVNVG